MDIRFSSSVIAVYAVTGVLMVLAAVILFILWKKRTNAKLLPVITGAAVFILFALMLKVIPAYPLLIADNAVSRTINGNLWLYALTAGLLAGIFEETGRFLAYRTVLKKHTARRTALDYGIGHGGIELLYVGFVTASITVLGILVNSGKLPELLRDVPESMLPAAQQKLEAYAAADVGTLFLGLLERCSALLMQVSFSVIVFRAARENNKLWYYPAAILLHAAVDFSAVLMSSQIVLTEVLILLYAAVLSGIAFKLIYPKLSDREEASP